MTSPENSDMSMVGGWEQIDKDSLEEDGFDGEAKRFGAWRLRHDGVPSWIRPLVAFRKMEGREQGAGREE